jgi:hypothetical protein
LRHGNSPPWRVRFAPLQSDRSSTGHRIAIVWEPKPEEEAMIKVVVMMEETVSIVMEEMVPVVMKEMTAIVVKREIMST